MLTLARGEGEGAAEMRQDNGSVCPLAREIVRSISITRRTTTENVYCGGTVTSSGVVLIPSIGIVIASQVVRTSFILVAGSFTSAGKKGRVVVSLIVGRMTMQVMASENVTAETNDDDGLSFFGFYVAEAGLFMGL